MKEYQTDCKDIVYIEEISDEFCLLLEPFAVEIGKFIVKSKEKIYASICFVKGSDDGVGIQINKRLVNLANILQAEIHFDGFE